MKNRLSPNPPFSALHRRRGGFSLVEVTLALGLMAFCMTAIFGLLPIGLDSNRTAIAQTEAVSLVSTLYADLKSTPRDETTSSSLGLPMAGNSGALYFSEDGTKESQTVARYRAQIFLDASAGREATTGRIVVSWPAQQDDPALASGRVESFVALNRN